MKGNKNLLTPILSNKLPEVSITASANNSPIPKSLLTSILETPKSPSNKNSLNESHTFDLNKIDVSKKSSLISADLNINLSSVSFKLPQPSNSVTLSTGDEKVEKIPSNKPSSIQKTPKSTLLTVLGAPITENKLISNLITKPEPAAESKPVHLKKASSNTLLPPPIALLSPTQQQHAIIVAYPSKNRNSLDVASFTPGLKIPTSDIQREPPKGFFYYCCNCIKP